MAVARTDRQPKNIASTAPSPKYATAPGATIRTRLRADRSPREPHASNAAINSNPDANSVTVGTLQQPMAETATAAL